MKRKITLLLLWVLGFSTACECEINDEPQPAMYGVPQIRLRISGKVTNAAGEPIKDIEVGSKRSEKKTRTNELGVFDYLDSNFSSTAASVTFTDIDGAANGGDFAAKEQELVFTEADFVQEAPEGEFSGGFQKLGVDVTLKEKE